MMFKVGDIVRITWNLPVKDRVGDLMDHDGVIETIYPETSYMSNYCAVLVNGTRIHVRPEHLEAQGQGDE